MKANVEVQCAVLKQNMISEQIRGICSDLDDTLCATNLFWAEHHIAKYGAPQGMSAKEVLRQYRYVKDVPWWQDNDEAAGWVNAHMDSITAKLELPVMEGALEGMRAVQSVSPIVLYLTGRSVFTNEGTRSWLSNVGFPELPVIAYPCPTSAATMQMEDRNHWKAGALVQLYPNVTGIIEDNADIIQALPLSYGGTIYLFSHHVRPRTSLDVVCCPRWEDISREIRRRTHCNGSQEVSDKKADP